MPDTEPNSYLSAKQTRHRFGDVCDMTLWRWIKDPALGFPPPLRINGRRFWKVADLERWEAVRMHEAA